MWPGRPAAHWEAHILHRNPGWSPGSAPTPSLTRHTLGGGRDGTRVGVEFPAPGFRVRPRLVWTFGG